MFQYSNIIQQGEIMEQNEVYKMLLQLLHAGSFQGKFSPLVLDCWKWLQEQLDDEPVINEK